MAHINFTYSVILIQFWMSLAVVAALPECYLIHNADEGEASDLVSVSYESFSK